jgi:hypothetical protein
MPASRSSSSSPGCLAVLILIGASNLFRAVGRMNLRGVGTGDLALTLLIALGILALVLVLPALRHRERERPAVPLNQHPLFDRQLDQYPR